MFDRPTSLKLPKDPIRSLAVLAQRLAERGHLDHVVLIGGQALYLWSLAYGHETRPPLEQAQIASADLDFVHNTARSINAIAEAWDAQKVELPDPGNPTPQEALVFLIDVDDEPVVIDFLSVVGGLECEEVVRKANFLPVFGAEIGIMNPFHCLKSRIYNRFNRGLGKLAVERENIRIKCAIEICRDYFFERLNAAGNGDLDIRDEMQNLNQLIKYARTREARKVAGRIGLNVLSAVPDHPIFNQHPYRLFLEKTISPLKAKLEQRCRGPQLPLHRDINASLCD